MNELSAPQQFHNAIHIWYFAIMTGDKKLLATMEKAIKMITKHLEDEEDADR